MERVPEDFDRAMFVVAHPDDIEYGLASVAARWTDQGKEVTYVLATSGEAGIDTLEPAAAGPLREDEERAGAAEVGVSTVEFLGLADGTLEPGIGLRRELARAIRRHRPQVVATMDWAVEPGWGGLNHADHRAVGTAALDAVRDAANRWIFRELVDEGLERWDGVRFAVVAASGQPTHGIDVTGYLEAGIRSLEAHRIYIDVLGGGFEPRPFLTGIAEAGGRQLGVQHAAMIRLIEL